ncbi:phosphopantetheine-binding protein [Kitasatospora sp. NPDC096147]|uniref:phosphopantetheine-binding protein n=1 Tax=Kitasatospora sp. NPDC096147 TaxID=3364093 RepID=UPI0037F2D960
MSDPAQPQALSLERIRQDVSDVLHLDAEELLNDEYLIDQGMDSIRLMSLVQRWRNEGVEVAFVDLAERPTIDDWHALLCG